MLSAFVGLSILAFNTSVSAVSLSSLAKEDNTIVENPLPDVKTDQPAVTSVSDALREFKSLSRKERRDRLREVKKEIKHFKQERKMGSEPSTNTLLLVILALLLPPLAVYLHQGEINSKFWISLILTLLFFIPGVIYALIVILGNE